MAQPKHLPPLRPRPKPFSMSLPPAAPQRQLKHRRQIDVQVFACGNGLWEVDAVLTDVKTRDAHMVDGPRPAGTPIHDMLLRIVLNESSTSCPPAPSHAGCPTKACATSTATPTRGWSA